MPDDPLIQELQRKLDEAQWLMEEDREDLARKLGELRELWAMMAARPRLDRSRPRQQKRNSTRHG